MSIHDQTFVPLQNMAAGARGVAVASGAWAGMYHPGAAEEGILILPPFGHEALSCAKSLRLLAEELAARGYPVLRLDYPGTGDAPGNESECEMLESRSVAAADAAAWMRDMARLKHVSLAGVRLGATTALMAMAAISPKRMLLAAPVLNGKAYLRELRQMRALYVATAEAANFDANEFNGFALSDETVGALRGLDLRRAPPPAGIAAAVLCPDGPGAARSLAESWLAAGASVDVITYDDVDQLLADPAQSPPERTFVAAVSEWFGEARRGEAPVWTPQPSRTHGDGWTERACRFGAADIFGVICEPGVADGAAPALVIVNTGGNSHVGWGRQTVELARRLARDGVTTLRIDVAGVGETADASGRGDRIVYCSDAAADVLAAADYLEGQGHHAPAIAGICSGAFLIFHALAHRPAVSGALMVNLQKFHWKEGDELILYSSIGSYFSRLLSRDALARLLRGESDVRGIASTVASRIGGMIRTRMSNLLPRRPAVAAGECDASLPRDVIGRALSQGVAVALAYTVGDGGVDEMRSHLGAGGRAVRDRGDFAFEMIADADHNFSAMASREKLYPLVLGFVRSIAQRRAVKTRQAA